MKQIVQRVRCAPLVGAVLFLFSIGAVGNGASAQSTSGSTVLRHPLFAGRSVTRGDRQSPLIALTFDDAPHPVYVPRLLALLRAENIKATFFLVGEQVKNFPRVARMIVDEKHEIGNHSLTHVDLRKASRQVAEREIVGMQELLQKRLGIRPSVYRPAYGSVNSTVKEICAGEGLDIVLWGVDTNDWRSGSTSQTIVQNVLDNVSSGSIVLFHATRERTVEAVGELIPVLRYRGYKFATCSELLRDRAAREEIRRRMPKSESSSATEERIEIEPLPPIKRPVLPSP